MKGNLNIGTSKDNDPSASGCGKQSELYTLLCLRGQLSLEGKGAHLRLLFHREPFTRGRI